MGDDEKPFVIEGLDPAAAFFVTPPSAGHVATAVAGPGAAVRVDAAAAASADCTPDQLLAKAVASASPAAAAFVRVQTTGPGVSVRSPANLLFSRRPTAVDSAAALHTFEEDVGAQLPFEAPPVLDGAADPPLLPAPPGGCLVVPWVPEGRPGRKHENERFDVEVVTSDEDEDEDDDEDDDYKGRRRARTRSVWKAPLKARMYPDEFEHAYGVIFMPRVRHIAVDDPETMERLRDLLLASAHGWHLRYLDLSRCRLMQLGARDGFARAVAQSGVARPEAMALLDKRLEPLAEVLASDDCPLHTLLADGLDTGVAPLADGLARNTSLRQFVASEFSLLGTLRLLQGLVSQRGLRRLAISFRPGRRDSPANVATFVQGVGAVAARPGSQLLTLQLEQCPLAGALGPVGRALEKSATLTALRLDDVCPDASDLAAVAVGIAASATLRRLELVNCLPEEGGGGGGADGDEEGEDEDGSKAGRRAAVAALDGVWGAVAASPTLEYLSVSGNGLAGADLAGLFAAAAGPGRCRRLAALDVSRNAVRPGETAGADELRRMLAGAPALHTLSANNCGLGDAWAAAVADGMRGAGREAPGLRCLDLFGNPLGKVGMEALAAAARLSASLEHVTLQSTTAHGGGHSAAEVERRVAGSADLRERLARDSTESRRNQFAALMSDEAAAEHSELSHLHWDERRFEHGSVFELEAEVRRCAARNALAAAVAASVGGGSMPSAAAETVFEFLDDGAVSALDTLVPLESYRHLSGLAATERAAFEKERREAAEAAKARAARAPAAAAGVADAGAALEAPDFFAAPAQPAAAPFSFKAAFDGDLPSFSPAVPAAGAEDADGDGAVPPWGAGLLQSADALIERMRELDVAVRSVVDGDQ